MDLLLPDEADANIFKPRALGMIKAGRLQYTRIEYERILSMLSEDGSQPTSTLCRMIEEAIDVIDAELQRRSDGGDAS